MATKTQFGRPMPRAIALAAGGVLAIMAAYFLTVGVRVTIATTNGDVSSGRQQQISAVIPLACAVVYLVGVWTDRRRVAIEAAGFAMLYGVLFVFSVGFYYAPIGLVMLLAALLAIRRAPRAEQPT